jgi:hypothetical protein
MLIDYTSKPQEFNGELYDQRHGGPFDRGAADSYYNREFNPHFYVGATAFSERVELANMTAEEITAYTAGYRFNEQFGDKKLWD